MSVSTKRSRDDKGRAKPAKAPLAAELARVLEGSSVLSEAESSLKDDAHLDSQDSVNESDSESQSQDSVNESDLDSKSDSESESQDSDSDLPKLKKKKNTDDGAESFASAVTAIVGSRLKAYDRKDPILARNKTSLHKLESDKLEAKAKRALAADKKQDFDRVRVTNLLPMAGDEQQVRRVLDKERAMKKIAQRGVVRLFNAVLSTQVRTHQAVSTEKVGHSKKEELMNEISKEHFLDLVQAAGEE